VASTEPRPELSRSLDSSIGALIFSFLNALNELRLGVDRDCTEPTPESRRVGRGGQAGQPQAGVGNVRERGSPEHSGAPLQSTPAVQRWRSRVTGHGQVFTAGVRVGNLKIWKTENLTSWSERTARQNFRISVFQSSTDARSQGPGSGGDSERPISGAELPFIGWSSSLW